VKLNGSHLGSLHVFLVAARHLSFSRAADDYRIRPVTCTRWITAPPCMTWRPGTTLHSMHNGSSGPTPQVRVSASRADSSHSTAPTCARSPR